MTLKKNAVSPKRNLTGGQRMRHGTLDEISRPISPMNGNAKPSVEPQRLPRPRPRPPIPDPRQARWLSELKFTPVEDHYSEINAPLSGRAVCILGGGPSLTRAHVDAIKDFPLLLVNNAYMLVHRPTLLVALDRRYFEWHGESIRAAGHTVITSVRGSDSPMLKPPYAKFKKDREATLTDQRDTLTGTNSGHAAVQLAIHLGATRIYCFGFDMGFPDTKTHWHDGHPVPSSESNYVRRFRPRFEKLATLAADKGILVAAATKSMANIPHVTLEAAVKDLQHEHCLDYPETPATL